jgi:hypothetical protein
MSSMCRMPEETPASSSADAPESRHTLNLRTGTKLYITAALLLLIAAAYFYFVPVHLTTKDGGAFGCGSAGNPPTEDFAKSICLDVTSVNLYKAYALAGAAVLMGILGYVFFGTDRVKELAEEHGDTKAIATQDVA